jgi:DegV family protein with EDD domain
MSVLFCDTDCELWYTAAKELKLQVIGMPYTIDGEEKLYDLGENTDFKGFFDKMRNGSTAVTSGLNQETYINIFEPWFKRGEDILYIAFSSKMSSTFKYMDLAVKELKAKYPKVRFECFDTLNICMGAGIMVYMAARKFNANGGDIDATVEYLDSILQRVTVLFVVDNLKYLARGGRISPNKARIGNFMQVKPVLTIDKNGEIDVYTKQNGAKKAMHFVLDELKRKYTDIDGAPIVIVNADCQPLSDELNAKIKEEFPSVEVWSQPIGPVIGAHCGPGTYGVIFTSRER